MDFKPISTAPQVKYKRLILASEDGPHEVFIGYWDGRNFIRESNENLAFAYAWAKIPEAPDRSLFPKIDTDEE